MSAAGRSRLSWVLRPALITLVVLLLRLWGELADWSPTLFGKAAGGAVTAISKDNPTPAQSLFGIFWLIPVFGIYFGARLRRHGLTPAHRGKALLFAVLGLAVLVVASGYSFVQIDAHMKATPDQPMESFASLGYLIAVAAWIGVAVAFFGWRDLVKLEIAYGLLARLPVVMLTVILIPMGTGTHFEKLPPFAPAMDDAARTLFLCLPQLTFWTPLTILGGTLFGVLTAFLVPLRDGVPAGAG